MSYQMIHLEVAYRLLEHYQWINSPGNFLLGAIAPDAVHFHKEYQVDLKEKSHLWNCGPKWGITTQSDKWKRNVLDFWNLHKEDTDRDYIAGYCIHILTDWLNDIRIWTPFRDANMENEGVEEIYHIYGQEAYGSDQWLFRNSQNTGEIMKLLKDSRACAVEGGVDPKIVAAQKQHILCKQYENAVEYEIDSYQYCSRNVLMEFVEECVKNFKELLPIDIV